MANSRMFAMPVAIALHGICAASPGAVYAGRKSGTAPVGAGGAIEVWFADEARIGQKNKITRRWARRGTRPAAHPAGRVLRYNRVRPMRTLSVRAQKI
jgi:hypothetical protein